MPFSPCFGSLVTSVLVGAPSDWPLALNSDFSCGLEDR